MFTTQKNDPKIENFPWLMPKKTFRSLEKAGHDYNADKHINYELPGLPDILPFIRRLLGVLTRNDVSLIGGPFLEECQ